VWELPEILTASGSTGTITIIQVGVEYMTDEHTGKESRESRYSSVWSDLRAMKLLEKLQQDVRELKAAQRRLLVALLVVFILLGGGGAFLWIVYSQLQQLRSQPEATQSHFWEVRSRSSSFADQLSNERGENRVSRRRTSV